MAEIGSLVARVKRLVLGNRGEAPAAVEESALSLDDPMAEARLAGFLEGFRARSRNSGAAMGGAFHFVRLNGLKKHFGDSWPDVAERAHKVAEETIRRHLVTEDLFSPYGELAFLVIFAGLNAHAAAMKCAVIAAEIESRLVGTEMGAARPKVKAAVVTVDPTKGVVQIKDVPSVTALVRDTLAPKGAAPAPAPADPPQDPEVDEAGELAAARDELHTMRTDFEAALRMMFRPMWFVRRQVLSTYLCQPVTIRNGQRRNVDHELYCSVTGNGTVMLDQRMVRESAAVVERLMRRKKRVVISVPVHFNTLIRFESGRAYGEALSEIDPETKRCLVLEMIGAPPGVTSSRLSDAVGYVRSHCRAVVLRRGLEVTDFDRFRNCGVLAVGIDVAQEKAREADLIPRLNRFARQAEQALLQSYIRGVGSLSLTVAAVAAGFTYIDGARLEALDDVPEDIRLFDLDDLYEPLLKPDASATE